MTSFERLLEPKALTDLRDQLEETLAAVQAARNE